MTSFWKGFHGLGLSGSIVGPAGVPKENIKWLRNYGDCGAVLDPLIGYGDNLYYIVKIENDEKVLLSINLENGNVVGQSKALQQENWEFTMFANSNKVIVGCEIYDTNSLSKIADLSDLAGENSGLDEDSIHFMGEKYTLSALSDKRYLIFDLIENSAEIKKFDFDFGWLTTDSDRILSVEETNNTCFLNASSINGNKLWSADVSVYGDVQVINDAIFYTSEKSLIKLNLINGEFVNDLDGVDCVTNEFISQNSKCFSDDTFSIVKDYELYTYLVASGELLFKKIGWEILTPIAAGDLLFFIRDTWFISALDRYSGEEVWSYTERYTWQSLIYSNNHLIVYCASGEIVCFDCGEPYISPYRPN